MTMQEQMMLPTVATYNRNNTWFHQRGT